MLCRKATLLFLCIFMAYGCASFHCSKEVQWLLEDARLHEMQHTSRDAMLAERFHTIADYLDSIYEQRYRRNRWNGQQLRR